MGSSPQGEALQVRLQLQRAKESNDPFAFHPEPQEYILPTVGGGSPSASFPWTKELIADLEAIRQPGRSAELLRRVGETLRRFLLSAGWAEVEREIAQALAEGRRVLLSIRSSAAELYALPWELLLLRSGQAIGEEDRLLLRFEWPESASTPERPTPRREGGRILVAWSAAAGGVPAPEHIRALAAACRAGRYPFHPTSDVLPQASLAGLAERLEAAEKAGTEVAVLHLLCHGGRVGSSFGLCLDGAGGSVILDAAQVRKQLAPFAHRVRLVVLSACDSGHPGPLGSQLGSVAQQLHRSGFQAVIASRYPLSVAGSIQLTETLYDQLLSGQTSLEDAFLAVRKRLSREETRLPREQQRLDWASLQLYARQDDGDNTRPLLYRPYRGLLAFEPEHRSFFFGRQAEVEEIDRDLQALIAAQKPRFVVIAGASGTGKSSLLLAGALPKLQQQDPQLRLLRMRPGGDPSAALQRLLLSHPADDPALLFVDQFEEIFTQTTDAAVRQAFVRRLWALAGQTTPVVSVLLTLRIDFLGRCGELALDDAGLRLDQIAYSEAHRVFIAGLAREQLRRAIEGPAHVVGLRLQDGLVERMLDDVGGEPGALPLLQDALDVLWQHRSGDTLTQSAYLALGGAVGALQRRADDLFTRLSAADQHIAQRILISLVSVSEDTALDTRRLVSLADLRQTTAPSDAEGFERVLQSFVRERLLVQGGDEGRVTVEVAHEALIRKWPRLRGWLDESRAGLLVQRRIGQAAQQWLAQREDESLLYRGTQLAQASEWRKTWAGQLGEPAQRFLDASEARKTWEDAQAEAQRQKERTRARQTLVAAVVLGALFIAALFASGVAYFNGLLAEENAAKAQGLLDRNRASLFLALAQNERDDPTMVAALLREANLPSSPLWMQLALGVLQREIATVVLRRHIADVRAIAASRDGRLIATGGQDQVVLVWEVGNWDQPLVQLAHPASVLSVAFSPDGQSVVTGSSDGKARIFGLESAPPRSVLGASPAELLAVAFSPDGQKIVTGSGDGRARIWNADGSGEPIVLAEHRAAVTAVAFSPTGTGILTGSLDHTARLWSLAGPRTVSVFQGHESDVTAVAFSPDGTAILTGSTDGTARLWRPAGDAEPRVFRGHRTSVLAVAFSPDGQKILTGSADKTMRSWHIDGSMPPLVYPGHGAYVSSVAVSPDGTQIFSGSGDATVRIWPAEGHRKSVLAYRSGSAVRGVAVSPDGTQIASAHEDQQVRLWQVGSSTAPRLLTGHTAVVTAVAFSPDGTKLASASLDRTVRLFSTRGAGEPRVFGGHEAGVGAVAFSPDGRKLVSGSEDQTLRVVSIDDSGPPLVLRGHRGSLTAVAFRPDGKSIVSGAADGTVRLWSADGTGSPQVFSGHERAVTSVALSPDGLAIASGSADRTVRIWNTLTGKPPQILRGHESYVLSVAISRRNLALATGTEAGTVHLFRDTIGSEPLVLRGHTGSVIAVAFSPSDEWLASGSSDGTILRWLTEQAQVAEAVRDATSDCLPVERRPSLFGEPLLESYAHHQRCRDEVAQRRRQAGARSP